MIKGVGWAILPTRIRQALQCVQIKITRGQNLPTLPLTKGFIMPCVFIR